ncbi:hypothetical protein [Nocardia tengchongensis]|uniref:hypothetical protein n=1 Tax=Nocardia tengchongensis TaxID=2055889 RepID=UPI003615F568
MGRPMLCPDAVLADVMAMVVDGQSDSAIAAVLNGAEVPTPAGRPQWQRCHVWRLRRTARALRLLDGLVGEGSRAA